MAAQAIRVMRTRGGERFWDLLGRWLPWLGTPGLLKAVVLLNAVTFVIITAEPAYAEVLALNPAKIWQGQIWRLVTYIFVPETRSLFWIFFALLFLWFLASALEETWGSLKLNVFYLVGMLGCTVAAFFSGVGTPSNTFLNLSLFFAFATVVPDYEIFLLFIARVKIKYVAWFLAAIFGLQFLLLPLPAKFAMGASLLNYLIFFGPGFFRARHEQHRDVRRLRRFQAEHEATIHRCAACGRTEVSDPDAEFRVADSGEEFCIEHLPGR